MDGQALRSAYLAALPDEERRVRRRIFALRLSALLCLLYTAALVWAAAAHPRWLPAWTLLQWPLVQKLVILFGCIFGPWLLLPLLYRFRAAPPLLRQLLNSGLAPRMLAGTLVDDALLAALPARLRRRLPGKLPEDHRGQLRRLFLISRRYTLPGFAPWSYSMHTRPAVLLIGAVPLLLCLIPLHIAWQLAISVLGAFCLPMFIPILQEQVSLLNYLRRELPGAEVTGQPLAELERRYSLHLQLNLVERMSMTDPAGYRGLIHVPLVLLLWAPAVSWFWLDASLLPLVLALLLHLLLWLAFRAWLSRLEAQVEDDLARSDIPGQIARGELAVTEEKVAGYGNGTRSFSSWMKQFDADGPDYSFAMTVAHVCRHARRHLYPSRRWPDEVMLLIGVFGLLASGVAGTVLLQNQVQRGVQGELLLLLAPFHFSMALIMFLIAIYLPLAGIPSRRLLELLRERIGE